MTLIGNVSKWYNRKGFGFINVVNSDSEHVGKDLFCHHKGVNVSGDGFKYLIPGEYVSFDLDQNDKGVTCVNVTGVHGGPLLMENNTYRYKYFPKRNRDVDEGEVDEGEVDEGGVDEGEVDEGDDQ